MSEFDNETADVSAVLDAYMYLDYQYKSKGKQEENLNESSKNCDIILDPGILGICHLPGGKGR